MGLGDDGPGDDLNAAQKSGLHFGFLYCHQADVVDPEFGAQRACSTIVPPVLILGPHAAAIGFRLHREHVTSRYRNAAIIAEHGSWNRATASRIVAELLTFR